MEKKGGNSVKGEIAKRMKAFGNKTTSKKGTKEKVCLYGRGSSTRRAVTGKETLILGGRESAVNEK